MKEHPIIFNTEMVRAVLEGRKTQTRRVIKVCSEEINYSEDICGIDYIRNSGLWRLGFNWKSTYNTDKNDCHYIKCPYGKVGDILWVRETWRSNENDFHTEKTLDEALTRKLKIYYYADDNPRYRDKEKWKPSIYMPKKYCRIKLEITDIRVERVQEIEDRFEYGEYNDIEAEGIEFDKNIRKYGSMIDYIYCHLEIFQKLWDSINKKHGYGWDVNPYVWIVEFKRRV